MHTLLLQPNAVHPVTTHDPQSMRASLSSGHAPTASYIAAQGNFIVYHLDAAFTH